MTTITQHSVSTTGSFHPIRTAAFGVLAFAGAMVAGDAFDLNKDYGNGTGLTTTASEWLVTAAIAAVGLAVGVALGLRAWNGDAARLSKYALGLSVASAVTFVAFWSGWPSVFSAVAVGLALEHRRRIGSFATSTAIAAGLGVIAFVATAYICVTG